MSCKSLLIVLAASLSTMPAALAADLWSGWLGPHRNGQVDNVELPTPLPETLTEVWRRDAGTGYGSPLVAEDRIFLHSREGEQEVIRCLRRRDGEVIWQKSVDVPFQPGGGGEWHGRGPKSTPAYQNGRLFTMSILGDLSAWDAKTGRLLWRSDFSKQFQPNRPYWGVSTSPLVVNNMVIAHFGNDTNGTLAALQAETGKVLWTAGQAGTSYSSPVAAPIHNVPQVIEWNHEALTGVGLDSGNLLWSVPFAHQGSNQNMPTPVVNGNRVYLGAENRGLHCFEIQRDGRSWKTQRIWSNDDVALDMSTAVITNDLLFGLSHYGKGRLFCVDPKSGKILWQSSGRTGQHSNMLAVADHIVTLLDHGTLQVIQASGTGYEVAATWQVSQQPTWAPPVLLPEGVLIKDQTTLRLLKF